MSLGNALRGGAAAGVGLLALLIGLLYILFYVALVIIVFGGAYYVLDHLGVLLLGVPL
jgi:hypothetical protein